MAEKLHQAYSLYPPIKIATNLQIESITGYDNNVILGTRQGHLLMYSLQKHPTENKMDLQLLQYDKNFSKKPIVQLQVVSDCNLLFSLSDNIINVNDTRCHSFPLIHSASKTKGANVFALDVKRTKSLTGETSIAVRLVVAVKRKLQFWYWKHDKLLEFGQDIELNDIPKVLSWGGNSICVGYKTEYVIFDLSDEKRKKMDLFPTSSSRTIEPCVAQIDEKYFGVVKDEYLITISTSSEEEKDLKNLKKGDLSGVGSSSGNLASMVAASSVLDLKNKVYPTLAWKEPLQMLVHDEPYLVGLISDSVEIRVFDAVGAEKTNLIQTIPELSKARFLIQGRRGLLYAASINLLWCIQAVDITQQRQALLQDKKFHLALQLTNLSEESEQEKKDMIHQIQTYYAFDLFINKKFRESMKEFAKLSTDPCDVIRLFPDLFPSFENMGKKMTSSMSSSFSGAEMMSNLPKLADKDLENGYLALIDYLVEIRYSQDKNKDKDKKEASTLLSIIDTTLLKCYLETNDSFVASLIRLNNCHLEESEKILESYKKYGELIILYQTKGQHKRALQLLKSQANVSGSSLHGYERTIQYLQHLGSEHKQLIFEFSDWILESHPIDGLKIFTEDIQEVENLPRADVLDHLLKNHKSLVVPYLEHIIHIWNEPKPIFHNILIQQYRDKIAELKSIMDIDNFKDHQQSMDNTKEKLISFLKSSSHYHAEKVLVEFPYNDLFEERAIVLGKLGKHEKVLAIYIQILGNVEKAIEYCDQVYKATTTKYHDVYIILIKTLINPPTTPPYSDVKLHPRCLEPDVEGVLDILERFASRINPCTVLPILPDNIPISRLHTFLEVSLHDQLEQKRKTQILKGLYYGENLTVQEQKMHLESKSFSLTEISTCSICNKRFGNQASFVRLPNGDVIHIACQEHLSVS